MQHLTRRQFGQLTVGSLALASTALAEETSANVLTADVCIYGGTASGVMAAVAAAKDGWRVTIVEPSRWLGGMTGGGLDHVDWGREEAVGGSTRAILKRELDDADYRKVLGHLVEEHSIQVIYEHRLGVVRKRNAAIEAIDLDYAPPDKTGCPIGEPEKKNARTVAAKVFIDCSYEGDLMAKAGVSYTWGRESKDRYNESLAGVRPNLWEYKIDP
jgi:NADPH-dependent 2,4-dienoyl-CoA reductase/sulfur reductase-like enzyme